MAVQDVDLERLISELPQKERRARNRYLGYTIVALVLGGAWLGYSFHQVSKLREESEKLRSEVVVQKGVLEETKLELKARNEELETVAQQLRIPLDELHNLKSFGFLSNTEGLSDLRTYVEQSSKARAELQSIASPVSEKTRRGSLSIRYFVRGSDNGRVKQAIESLQQDYGFAARAGEQQEPNTYTNAVWVLSTDVTTEDIKLVAYYLLLRGIQLKYIGPPTSTPQKVRRASDAIWVVAEPKVKDEPPLTVEQIKALTP